MRLADPDSRDEDRSIPRCLVERIDMDPLETDFENIEGGPAFPGCRSTRPNARRTRTTTATARLGKARVGRVKAEFCQESEI